MKPQAIRVVIADDDPIVRELVRSVLARHAEISIVGEISNGLAIVDHIEAVRPDILLLDLLMPNQHGMETLRLLATTTSRVKVILLCAVVTNRQILDALRFGARGVLPKKNVDQLVPCIYSVLEGGYWIESQPFMSSDTAILSLIRHQAEFTQFDNHGLSLRQSQVIELVAAGNTNRDIARILGISEETVKRHLANIFHRLGVSNRVELAVFASGHRRPMVRNVLDGLYAFAGLLEIDGTLIEVNRAALEAAGITAEEVLGKKFWECCWWNHNPSVQQQLRQAIEDARRGESVRYNAEVRVVDGFITIDFALNPIRDQQGGVTNLVASAVEIGPRTARQTPA